MNKRDLFVLFLQSVTYPLVLVVPLILIVG